jgi:hypothetical protein
VGEDERAVAAEDVRKENFGVASGDVNGGFGDDGTESHKSSCMF